MLDPTELTRDPTAFSWVTYLWVIGLSLWGGLVSFYTKVQKGIVRAFNLTELLGELATSGLTGVVTFYLCELSDTPPLLSAVFIAVSGHMGSRLIFMLESRIERKAKQLLGDD